MDAMRLWWAIAAAVTLAACSGSCGAGSSGSGDGEVTTCGNGLLEAGESCDDGNTAAGDCCSASCNFETAGSLCNDSLFCNGIESCDGAGTCTSSTGSPCPPGNACDEDLDRCSTLPMEGLEKYPILFIHGHGLSSGSWASMIEFLTAEGYPSEFLRAIDLAPNDGPNQAAAEEQIAPAVEAFLDEVNEFLGSTGYTGPDKTKIDLVSHSMGALSSRWYTAMIAPHRVHTWISIGGANHGTDDLCPFVGATPTGADDACPAYSTDPADVVQLTLNGQPRAADVDETPYGIGEDSPGVAVTPPDQQRRILYVTIRTEPDNWISPDESATIDGAGGVAFELPPSLPATETAPGNFLMRNNPGHDAMLRDEQTMRLVNAILAAHDG